jgi:hypothetical protein
VRGEQRWGERGATVLGDALTVPGTLASASFVCMGGVVLGFEFSTSP